MPIQETQKTWVQSLDQEDPLEEGLATHSQECSCLENSMDRGAWAVTVPGVAESDMTEQSGTDGLEQVFILKNN